MKRMPTVYIPHGGGPCFFMDWDPPHEWDRMAAYLRNLREDIGKTPAAIILVSAHWEEKRITVQSTPAPDLLFDYYGFPPHTYQLTYPAPGAPELAARIKMLLQSNGIDTAEDSSRDFDHGVFIPLLLSYPDANIPIVQLSLRSDLDPAAHLTAGRALAPLRDENVLIIGSGMSFHNMRILMSTRERGGRPLPEMSLFDDWLRDAATHPDPEVRNRLLAGWDAAPGARFAHPREEHLIPLHVVAGAAGADQGRETFRDIAMGAPISAYQFG
mgnify:FL=1|tara:strand:+ start:7781 stop:8593 length:813 start_codon:yes stop_codon:yes gene_type:complete